MGGAGWLYVLANGRICRFCYQMGRALPPPATRSVSFSASAAASAVAAICVLTLVRDIFMVAFPSVMLLPPPEVPVADADRLAAGPPAVRSCREGGRRRPAGVAGQIHCGAGSVL